LKQGDALSPLLFSCALEYALRRVQVFQGGLKLTLCRSNLNPYCLGRKTVFFSGHLNLHAKPETGIPYREKNYNK
jgi:hypothetical protein